MRDSEALGFFGRLWLRDVLMQHRQGQGVFGHQLEDRKAPVDVRSKVLVGQERKLSGGWQGE